MNRFADKELIIDGMVIHRFEEKVNNGAPFVCDDGFCPNTIESGGTYYWELYPDNNAHQWCLECSATTMARTTNKLFECIAKSIRVDRQAMAEWWMGEHAGDEYHEEGVRRNCPVCSDEYWLWVEGREGKAPWGTD